MERKTIFSLICAGFVLALVSCAGGGTTKDTAVAEELPPADLTERTDPDVAPDPDVMPDPDVVPDVVDVRPDTVDVVPEDGLCVVGLTGDACTSGAQCGCIPSSARECVQSVAGHITFRGGYCSARCTAPADCGANANCAEVTTGTRYCLKRCSSASQCRMSEGYQCTTIPMSSDPQTYCLPDMGTAEGG